MPGAGTKQQKSEHANPVGTNEHLQVTPAAVMSEFGRMCIDMSASGAVIAVRDLAGIRCTVSFRDAPAVGSRLPADSALISPCVETGQVVLWEDARNDASSDPSVATHLTFRSAVAVPIQVQDAVVGLIEVFCSEPFAISPAALAGLKEVAKSFAALMIFDAANGGQPVVGGALERPVILSARIAEREPDTIASPPAKTSAPPEKRGISETAATKLQLPSDRPIPARVWIITAALLLVLSLLLLLLFGGAGHL